MSLPQSPYPGQPPHHDAVPAPNDGSDRPAFLRWALWVAIGALILAALVCVVWVLIGPDNGIIGRAFLTILLLAGFAGVAILDASLAPRRPAWFSLLSMIAWVVTLLVGALLIWMPEGDLYNGFDRVGRFVSFLLVVLILQLGVLHVRLYLKSHQRHVNGFTRAIVVTTLALVTALAVMLVLALTFHEFIDFGDLYWRFVVAITILAAVGTALIPIINALFAPKRPRSAAEVAGYPLPPWPTYADGATPLPSLPDGQPDWNAYYTGHPTYPVQQGGAWPSQTPGTQHPAAQQPGYPQQQPQQLAGHPQPQPGYPQPHPAAQQPGYPQQQPQPGYPQPDGYQGYPPQPPLPPQ